MQETCPVDNIFPNINVSVVRFGSIRDRFGIDWGSIWINWGSIRDRLGIDSEWIRDWFKSIQARENVARVTWKPRSLFFLFSLSSSPSPFFLSPPSPLSILSLFSLFPPLSPPSLQLIGAYSDNDVLCLLVIKSKKRVITSTRRTNVVSNLKAGNRHLRCRDCR